MQAGLMRGRRFLATSATPTGTDGGRCMLQILEALTNEDDGGVTMPSEVKSSFAFGFSLFLQYNNTWTPNTNDAGPFVWVNGSGDMAGTPEADQGSFERLKAPSAHAVISDLSHFSIADRSYSVVPRATEVESTLPREEQIARVAQCVRAWLNNPLAPGSEGAIGKALRETYARGAVVSYREQL